MKIRLRFGTGGWTTRVEELSSIPRQHEFIRLEGSRVRYFRVLYVMHDIGSNVDAEVTCDEVAGSLFE